MSLDEESELDELSWKIIHGQHLPAEQHNRYYELWIKEKAERDVAIKKWSSAKIHGATISPQP